MGDVKGRFKLHPIDAKEAKFKYCKVVKQAFTRKAIPYIVTHDGRTIRYHDPVIKVNDTVQVNILTGKVDDVKYFCVVPGNATRIFWITCLQGLQIGAVTVA